MALKKRMMIKSRVLVKAEREKIRPKTLKNREIKREK